jgi:hypothetical protein
MKKNAKRSFTVSVKTPEGTERKDTLEGTVRNGSFLRFREMKMRPVTFVPISRMRACYFNLKASLGGFNIAFAAECECGGGLKTEEYVSWIVNCTRTKGQR